MHIVGAFEAKNRFGQLLAWVEGGEAVTITRHGKVVARLVPPEAAPDPEVARAAVRRLRERAAALRAGVFDWAEWKGYRDEGRR